MQSSTLLLTDEFDLFGLRTEKTAYPTKLDTTVFKEDRNRTAFPSCIGQKSISAAWIIVGLQIPVAEYKFSSLCSMCIRRKETRTSLFVVLTSNFEKVSHLIHFAHQSRLAMPVSQELLFVGIVLGPINNGWNSPQRLRTSFRYLSICVDHWALHRKLLTWEWKLSLGTSLSDSWTEQPFMWLSLTTRFWITCYGVGARLWDWY